MFPYYVPAGIGLLFTILAVVALAHAEQYQRRWPRMIVLVAASLLWVPALILFVIAPAVWPQATDGQSATYYQLMGWQIVWIFLGIPLGVIVALFFTATGSDGKPKGVSR